MLMVTLLALRTPPGIGQQATPPPTFDGAHAAAVAAQIAGFADRTPGTTTATLAAAAVTQAFAAVSVPSHADRFVSTGPDGSPTPMTNIVATLPGQTRDTIVLLARRDDTAPGPDAGGSAVATGTIVELAGALSTLRHQHTIVIASVDGGTLGDAGARRLATKLRGLNPTAVIAVGAIATPAVVVMLSDRGDSRRRGSAGLVAATQAVFGAVPSSSATATTPLSAQLADLIVPSRIPGPQAPFVDRHAAAVLVSAAVPPIGNVTVSEPLLAANGQALNTLVLALDAAPLPPGQTGTYLTIGDRAVSGWVLAVLVASALVAPALVGASDILAARRARRALEPRLLAVTRVALPLAGLSVAAVAAGWIGVAPGQPEAPPFPAVTGIGVGTVLLLVVGFLAGVAAVRLVPARAAGGASVRPIVAARIAAVFACALAVVTTPAVAALLIVTPHAWCATSRVARRGIWPLRLLIGAPLLVPVAAAVLIGVTPGELVRAAADGRLPLATLLGVSGVYAAGLVALVGTATRRSHAAAAPPVSDGSRSPRRVRRR
jgi:hypothetical protein